MAAKRVISKSVGTNSKANEISEFVMKFGIFIRALVRLGNLTVDFHKPVTEICGFIILGSRWAGIMLGISLCLQVSPLYKVNDESAN
jgi:hypothetical protein